jgi:Ni,Fe-hydrogenase III large subunit
MTARTRIEAAPAIPCRPWPRHVLDTGQWRALVAELPAAPELVLRALWADTVQIHALFHDLATDAILLASVAVERGFYQALSPVRPAATLFERMIHDLWGHVPADGRDTRPWLDHGRWAVTHPMAPRPTPVGGAAEPPEFLPSEGTDLHQVPVGPIHAGIIEAGHLRLTASGETLVRLEVRLGYNHKGILLLLRGKPPRLAARFAARLSGDATVAHSIAFARAAEAALEVVAPPRAVALRAVMLELERIANHLGDIGALCNDAGFAQGLARFGWHREAMLRAAQAGFGHRLMMDAVTPGGVAVDIAAGGAARIVAALDGLDSEIRELRRVYDDHSGLVDRMVGTGRLAPELARAFGAGGVVGRASGGRFDARRLPGQPPYDALDVAVAGLEEGDVDARLRLRLAELAESGRLLRRLLADLPTGRLTVALPTGSGEGIGVAESFRGDVWHWLRLDGGLIASAFPADPSWLHWPLLEVAVAGNIVADFPLINKSFNCSYAGVDL